MKQQQPPCLQHVGATDQIASSRPQALLVGYTPQNGGAETSQAHLRESAMLLSTSEDARILQTYHRDRVWVLQLVYCFTSAAPMECMARGAIVLRNAPIYAKCTIGLLKEEHPPSLQ